MPQNKYRRICKWQRSQSQHSQRSEYYRYGEMPPPLDNMFETSAMAYHWPADNETRKQKCENSMGPPRSDQRHATDPRRVRDENIGEDCEVSFDRQYLSDPTRVWPTASRGCINPAPAQGQEVAPPENRNYRLPAPQKDQVHQLMRQHNGLARLRVAYAHVSADGREECDATMYQKKVVDRSTPRGVRGTADEYGRSAGYGRDNNGNVIHRYEYPRYGGRTSSPIDRHEIGRAHV